MSEPDFCGECFEAFRYDDCGGYNPPCGCGCAGVFCRTCCERKRDADHDDEMDEDAGWASNREHADSLWDVNDPDEDAPNA